MWLAQIDGDKTRHAFDTEPRAEAWARSQIAKAEAAKRKVNVVVWEIPNDD